MGTQKIQFLMWTEVEITIFSDSSKKKISKDIEKAFDIFSKLEKIFSRFNKDSHLSQLNKYKTLEVNDLFLDVLLFSKKIYKKTGFFFNPLVDISGIWYSSTFKEGIFKKIYLGNNLELENIIIIWNKVRLQFNQNLDFGWIVKWYTVDKVSSFLRKEGYSNFIVNAWGDIFVSWNVSWEKITVAIDSPFVPGDIFALLEIENMALSTSGTYKRNWEIGDESFHHIVTPKNGTNNNEIVSISLLTEKCVLSDVYATACIAMWIDKALQFLTEQKVDGIIIWSDKKVHISGNLEKYNFDVI